MASRATIVRICECHLLCLSLCCQQPIKKLRRGGHKGVFFVFLALRLWIIVVLSVDVGNYGLICACMAFFSSGDTGKSFRGTFFLRIGKPSTSVTTHVNRWTSQARVIRWRIR